MHSVRLLHVYEILWACIWGYLTTSERLHIYRKTCAFLERWRMFLLHRNAKTVTVHNLADNNNKKSTINETSSLPIIINIVLLQSKS